MIDRRALGRAAEHRAAINHRGDAKAELIIVADLARRSYFRPAIGLKQVSGGQSERLRWTRPRRLGWIA